MLRIIKLSLRVRSLCGHFLKVKHVLAVPPSGPSPYNAWFASRSFITHVGGSRGRADTTFANSEASVVVVVVVGRLWINSFGVVGIK